MPASNPRITAVVDKEIADWLRERSQKEGRSVSVLVRDILAEYRVEQEERFWAAEGEKRLETFDRKNAVPHDKAWD